MTPYYDEDGITIYHGDCRDILPHLEPVDMVLTDPPYGIAFEPLTLKLGEHYDAEQLDFVDTPHVQPLDRLQ